jgi:hypothetical protein
MVVGDGWSRDWRYIDAEHNGHCRRHTQNTPYKSSRSLPLGEARTLYQTRYQTQTLYAIADKSPRAVLVLGSCINSTSA